MTNRNSPLIKLTHTKQMRYLTLRQSWYLKGRSIVELIHFIPELSMQLS